MSKNELISRINQSGAKAAIIVGTYRGNPGIIEIIQADGSTAFEFRLESALLRREVQNGTPSKVNGRVFFVIKNQSSNETIELATFFADLVDATIEYADSPGDIQSKMKIMHWFEDAPRKRTLWTTYSLDLGQEMGPRIRIYRLKGHQDE